MNDHKWNVRGERDEFAADLESRLGVLTPSSGSFVAREISEEEIAAVSATQLAKQLERQRRLRRIASGVVMAVIVLALALVLLLQ